MVKYDLPAQPKWCDFYDRLNRCRRANASFDYHLTDYREADLVKMSICQRRAGRRAVDAGAFAPAPKRAAAAMVEKLKELIPPHMFPGATRPPFGGKTSRAKPCARLRKDVTAKCYGGDATRKRKLLTRQKEGQKKIASSQGRHSAGTFIAALKVDT